MAAEPALVPPGPLYCLLSPDSGDEVIERFRAAALNLNDVTVINDRRENDRRARVGLREEAATLIRLPVAGTTFRTDRRRTERRMEMRPASPPAALRALSMEHRGVVRFAHRTGSPTADAQATELIRRVQAGDSEALDALYRLYLAPLYGYMVVTLRDHHAAEDAVHEVFVRVLRALPRYELRGIPFRVWLFRIARNHLLNLMTRSHPEDAEDPEAVRRKLDGGHLDAPEADLAALSDDEFLRIIGILPLSQRQVLVLRYVFDMSFAEIAAVLETSAAAARNQQRRAFAALRPRLLARRRQAVPSGRLAMSIRVREPAVLTGRRGTCVPGIRL